MVDDSLKSKRAHLHYHWRDAQVDPVLFRYEIEAAVEVIAQTMQDFRPGYSSGVYGRFSVVVQPMHPDQREHTFTVYLQDSTNHDQIAYAEGRVFQVSETTCVIEGRINMSLRPLYSSIAAAGLVCLVISGVAAALIIFKIFTVELFCLGAIILFFLPLIINASHPRTGYDQLYEILEGMAHSLREMRHPYRLAVTSPYSKQAPKHSRPSLRAEKKARQVPVVKQINLLENSENEDEKPKQKRG